MRILFVSLLEGDRWGGSEELWYQTAQLLASKGHSVCASIHHHPQEPLHPNLAELQSSGIALYERRFVPAPSISRIAHRLLGRPLPDHSKENYLDWLRSARPDIAIISSGAVMGGLPEMRFFNTESIPFITLSQANSPSWWPTDEAVDKFMPLYTKASLNCFVSKQNHALFEQQTGYQIPNYQILQNPCSKEPLLNPLYSESDDLLHAAFVGRLDPQAKGQDILFDILSTDTWKKRDLRVSIFGAGRSRQSLERLCAMRGLSSKVVFCGTEHDATKIWNAHPILILPSRYEGLPLTLLEAMSFGRVPVVTDVGDNATLVEDGESGFLAATASVESFGSAMERMWTNRKSLPSIGKRAAQKAHSYRATEAPTMFSETILRVAQQHNVSTSVSA